MNKSILIVDTPKSCRQCNLRYDSYGECDVCVLVEDVIDGYYETDTKPEWCPLKEMPEQLKGNSSIYYQWGDYEDGWNNCIDEILGENNED